MSDENKDETLDVTSDEAAATPSEQSAESTSDKPTRLEEEGEIAADYLEELLDIADLDGDIELGVEHGRAAVEIVSDDESPRALQGLVGRDGDGLRRFQHAVQVAPGHFAVANRHDAGRVAALHVVAGDRGVDRADLAARHQLGFLDRALDRLHGGLDVHHDAALEAARLVRADADHLDRIARRVLADQRRHLGGADIQSDDQRFVTLAIHVMPCRRQPATAIGAGNGVGVAAGGGAFGASPQLSAKPLV